jgi:hypothetical protein
MTTSNQILKTIYDLSKNPHQYISGEKLGESLPEITKENLYLLSTKLFNEGLIMMNVSGARFDTKLTCAGLGCLLD